MDIRELRRRFRKKEVAFFSSPSKFLLFSITIIVSTLSFYKAGYIDLVTFVLASLWLIFWLNSSPLGKSFLIVASLVGFSHEHIGVFFGWFSYDTSLFWGVPLYILPGYGCIYWAAHNFWRNTKWTLPKKVLYPAAAVTIALFYLADLLVLNSFFRPELFANTVFLSLIILLVHHLSEPEQNLAFFVFLLTGFNEAFGTFLGAWTHYPFSLISSVPPYVFLVWVCVALTHSVLGDRKISRNELLLGIVVALTYSLNLIHLF